MFKKLLLITVLISPGAFSYDFGRTDKGESYDEYLDSIGSPTVKSTNRASKIWNILIPRGDDDANFIFATQYRSTSFKVVRTDKKLIVIKQGATSGRIIGGRIQEVCLRNNLARAISINSSTHCITRTHYWVNDVKFKLPIDARSATIGTNPNGDLISVFIGEDHQAYIGTKGEFTAISIGLHSKSDLKHILSIYPLSKNENLLSVYKYINKLNKSLDVYHLKVKNTSNKERLANGIKYRIYKKNIHNNGDSDIGINPQIYLGKNKEVKVASHANSGNYFWNFNLKDIDNKIYFYNENSHPDNIEINIGYGSYFQSRDLTSYSDVKPSSRPANYSRPTYDLVSSQLKEVSIAGRIFNTYLAITYAESLLGETLSETERALMKKFGGYIGFGNDYVGGEGIKLRLSFEEINGKINYVNTNGVAKNSIFRQDRNTLAMLWTDEQGKYTGISIGEYNYPTEIGLVSSDSSNDKNIYDLYFKTMSLSYLWGYDHSDYSSRYELNAHSYYYDYELALGIESFAMSQQAKDEARKTFSGGDTGFNFTLRGEARFNIGYIIRLGSSTLKGLGGILQVGYGVSIDGVRDSSKIGSPDEDGYIPSYRRYGLNYGPFVKAAAVF